MKERKVNRRTFLKGGVAVGAAAGLASISGIVAKKETEKVAKAFGKKYHDEFYMEIKPDFKGWSGENGMVNAMSLAKELNPDMLIVNGVGDNKTPGMTQLDRALLNSAENFHMGFMPKAYEKTAKCESVQYQFKSKEDATKAIKRAAKFYHADVVGVCDWDDRWVENEELPFQPKSVVVMGIEMDYEAYTTAPSKIQTAASHRAYADMLSCSYKLAMFIQELGYKAFAAGNDYGLAPAFAVLAGLGEIGRNNLLVTYEYGPRVRIVKVFTELELVPDRPITLGVTEFCGVCKRCAEQCPSDALSYEPMDWSKSIPGLKKWDVDNGKCCLYWLNSGTDCGTCISSCPYNKPDFWHHKLTTALTTTPMKPFLKYMDDLFGYGDTFDQKACIDFWKYEE